MIDEELGPCKQPAPVYVPGGLRDTQPGPREQSNTTPCCSSTGATRDNHTGPSKHPKPNSHTHAGRTGDALEGILKRALRLGRRVGQREHDGPVVDGRHLLEHLLIEAPGNGGHTCGARKAHARMHPQQSRLRVAPSTAARAHSLCACMLWRAHTRLPLADPAVEKGCARAGARELHAGQVNCRAAHRCLELLAQVRVRV